MTMLTLALLVLPVAAFASLCTLSRGRTAFLGVGIAATAVALAGFGAGGGSLGLAAALAAAAGVALAGLAQSLRLALPPEAPGWAWPALAAAHLAAGAAAALLIAGI